MKKMDLAKVVALVVGIGSLSYLICRFCYDIFMEYAQQMGNIS